jgi:hypothetical protein
MSVFEDKLLRVTPGLIIGLLIGIVWMYVFGYLMLLFAAVALFGGQIPAYYSWFRPSLSIFPVAVVFSLFRKHHVVSGILVIAVAFVLFGAYGAALRARYAVDQSGMSFSSAALQHFRHVRNQ